jgi:CelD/BcsL family acetyltransferase involved in cellulose biosynthesis
VLDLPNTFSAYVGGLSKSLRADLNRGQELRITDSEENLDHLFSLHARRWRRRGWPGAFLRRSRAFHRALEVPRSIYALWEGERPIGALYVLHGQGTTYFYQSGFDPAFGRQSPGSLLIGHAIREAIARGQTQFDFLRGDEPYKRRWKPTRVLDCGSVLMPLTRVGEAAAGWAGAVSRVEATARRRFEGDGSTQIVRARRSGAGSSA